MHQRTQIAGQTFTFAFNNHFFSEATLPNPVQIDFPLPANPQLINIYHNTAEGELFLAGLTNSVEELKAWLSNEYSNPTDEALLLTQTSQLDQFIQKFRAGGFAGSLGFNLYTEGVRALAGMVAAYIKISVQIYKKVLGIILLITCSVFMSGYGWNLLFVVFLGTFIFK